MFRAFHKTTLKVMWIFMVLTLSLLGSGSTKRYTPDSPTYYDVIEESKKFSKKLHDDFLDFEHRCIEELTELEIQRQNMNQKFRRLLVKLSKSPNELRLRTQTLMQKLENPTPGYSASSEVNPLVENTPMLKFQVAAESLLPLK